MTDTDKHNKKTRKLSKGKCKKTMRKIKKKQNQISVLKSDNFFQYV